MKRLLPIWIFSTVIIISFVTYLWHDEVFRKELINSITKYHYSLNSERVVHLFNKDFFLAYEDDGLDDDVKDFIESDLKLIYAHANRYKIVDIQGNNGVIIIHKKEVPYNKELVPISENLYRPDEIRASFGWCFIEGEKIYLIIPKRLTDEYTEAYNRKKSNETAYQRLKYFIDFLNDLENRDIDHPSKYLYTPSVDLTKIDSEQFITKFKSQTSIYKFIYPSMLNIKRGRDHKIKKSFNQYGDKLVAEILIFDKNNKLSDGFSPLIYDQDTWKFIILDSE